MAGDGGDWMSFLARNKATEVGVFWVGVFWVGEVHNNGSVFGFMGRGLDGDLEEGEVCAAPFGGLMGPRVTFVTL